MANLARTPAEVIAGEAIHGTLQERFNDMVHIASVMANRVRATGYTLKDVVSATSKRGVKQFSAYGKAMPKGTAALVSMAERAMALVEQNGPITPATYYATPKAFNKIGVKGLQPVGTTTGHVFAVDPLDREIGVGTGFVKPGTALPAQGPVPVARPKVDVGPNINRRQPVDFSRLNPMNAPQVGQPSRPRGLGMEALAPNGLRGQTYNAVGAYDRSKLDPGLSGALNAIGSDSRFNGLGIKSGYRTEKENRAVKGASNSQHLYGKAVDISGFRDLSPDMQSALVDKAMTQGVRGLGFYSSGALHMDARRNPAHWGIGGSYKSSSIKNYPAHLQGALRDLVGLAPGQPYTPSHPTNIPTPTEKPATPAYETQQRTALAAALEKAGIRGIGATTQVAPVEKVTRQALAPDRQMPSGAVRSTTPALSAALEKAGLRSRSPATSSPSSPATAAAPSQYAGRPASVAARVASPVSMGSTVGIPGRTAPEAPSVSPARDPRDMQNVAGPKGTFSVTPALDRAREQAGIASPTPSPAVTSPTPTRVAPVVSQPVAPVATQPRVVQPVQQPPQPVQAPAPDALSQGSFNARFQGVTPGLRASDIYGGQVGSAMSTGGNVVSRATPYGGTTVTNKYGATTATTPDGRQAATGNPFGGMSPNTRSLIGGIAGAALGALAGGPAGSLAGGLLGRQVATKGIGGGNNSQPGSGGGQAGGGGLRGLFGGGTVGNARGGNNQQSGGSQGPGIGGGGGRGQKRGGQGN